MDRVELKTVSLPFVLWLTGLSGAGKSTLSEAIQKRFFEESINSYILDGDKVREGLCQDLGFSDDDRKENVRRVSEVSALFVDAGVIVVTAFISPFAKDRNYCRSLLEKGRFVEVFVDCPLEVCEERDVKGLYKRARAGEIPQFTGIDSAYEAPENPEVHIRTDKMSLEESVDSVFLYLKNNRLI